MQTQKITYLQVCAFPRPNSIICLADAPAIKVYNRTLDGFILCGRVLMEFSWRGIGRNRTSSCLSASSATGRRTHLSHSVKVYAAHHMIVLKSHENTLRVLTLVSKDGASYFNIRGSTVLTMFSGSSRRRARDYLYSCRDRKSKSRKEPEFASETFGERYARMPDLNIGLTTMCK